MRKSLALLLVLVFLTAAVIVVLLSQVNSDSLPSGDNIPDGANETHGVEIMDFKWTSGWQNPGGLEMIKLFNITIHSLETEDMEGLMVQVKLFANDREIQTTTEFFGPGIIGDGAEVGSFDGLLGAEEVRELRGIVSTSLDELPSSVPVETVAKVMLGDVVFDEVTVP